ncbi:MAG TPA: acyltransferase [Polyangiaceae bacterium]|nr:acyltransferase [Polyangiaceae bacterium]
MGSLSDSTHPLSSEVVPTSLHYSASVHLGFLDGVRGLAAGYVVLHHVMLNVPRSPNAPGWERALRLATGYGHYAVDLFIVLSGYCLMLPVLRSPRQFDSARFLIRRAARILPPYYAAMLFSWALILSFIGHPSGTHWDVSIPVSARDIVYHSLLIHDLSEASAPKINHAHWSVAVEWKLYFLFPLLLIAKKRFGAVVTVVAATVSSYVLWLVLRRYSLFNPSPWGSSVYYLGLFAFGMLAADLAEPQARSFSPTFRRNINVGVALLSLVVVALSSRYFGRLGDLPLQVVSAGVGAWSAVLLVSLRVRSLPRWLSTTFSNPASEWIGRRSFSLYLTHAPILELVYRCLAAARVTGASLILLMLGLATPAAVLISAAFYRLVELPSHQLSRRVTAGA